MKTKSFFLGVIWFLFVLLTCKENYRLSDRIIFVNKLFNKYYLLEASISTDTSTWNSGDYYEIRKLLSSKSLLTIYRERNKMLAKEVAKAV